MTENEYKEGIKYLTEKLEIYKDEINRQKAEIERLKLELADTKRDLQIVLDNSISAKLPNCVLCGKGAILTKSLEDYDELIGDISAEGIKEFAERLKDKTKWLFSSVSINNEIDNILKEMVGEDK